MDFRQLRTFVHVVETGNITLAAGQLSIAQSALTRHIQCLESDLGVALLHRNGRGVELTSQGKVFLRRAQGILRDLVDAREEVRQSDAAIAGVAGFAAPPDLMPALFRTVIGSPLAQMPCVSLRFSTGYGRDVLDGIASGKTDIGLLCDSNPSETRRLHPILSERLMVIATRKTALNRSADEIVSGSRLVLPYSHHPIRRPIDAALARLNGSPVSVTEIDDLSLLLHTIISDGAVTIAPRRIIDCAPAGTWHMLRSVDLGNPLAVRNVVLIEPLDRLLSQPALQLRDMLLANARNSLVPAPAIVLDPKRAAV